MSITHHWWPNYGMYIIHDWDQIKFWNLLWEELNKTLKNCTMQTYFRWPVWSYFILKYVKQRTYMILIEVIKCSLKEVVWCTCTCPFLSANTHLTGHKTNCISVCIANAYMPGEFNHGHVLNRTICTMSVHSGCQLRTYWWIFNKVKCIYLCNIHPFARIMLAL